MNSSSDSGTALKGFYAYKNSFDEQTTWVAIPKDLTFFNTTDPYQDDAQFQIGEGTTRQRSQPAVATPRDQWSSTEHRHYQRDLSTHGLEALSAAALYTPAEASVAHRNPACVLNGSPRAKSIERPDQERNATTTKTAGSSRVEHLQTATESPIDPDLIASHAQYEAARMPETSGKGSSPGIAPVENDTEKLSSDALSELRMATMLKDFSRAPEKRLTEPQHEREAG